MGTGENYVFYSRNLSYFHVSISIIYDRFETCVRDSSNGTGNIDSTVKRFFCPKGQCQDHQTDITDKFSKNSPNSVKER